MNFLFEKLKFFQAMTRDAPWTKDVPFAYYAPPLFAALQPPLGSLLGVCLGRKHGRNRYRLGQWLEQCAICLFSLLKLGLFWLAPGGFVGGFSFTWELLWRSVWWPLWCGLCRCQEQCLHLHVPISHGWLGSILLSLARLAKLWWRFIWNGSHV